MKRLLAASIFGASLFSGAAFAQSTMGPPAVGPYVGASILSANYSTDVCPGQCDKTDVGGKIFGGYMFSPFFGLEGAWGSYGKAKLNANFGGTNVLGELQSSGFSGFVVGQYPIDQFRIFGKLGFARLSNDVDITVPNGFAATNSDNSTEFAWGLGATYMFTRNFGVRGEWESLRYQFEGNKDRLSVFSIGLQYNF
jgi:opacity protein-like surface antigen